ncbi:c-type cytochrome [Mesorhizobium sp. IMUNJ 23232]|uniref:c-type cytochrome n=1 Tax=Mesorhizobium sp. IMUNJ 23232 TaxID=3376064 RepID=UPI00378DF363
MSAPVLFAALAAATPAGADTPVRAEAPPGAAACSGCHGPAALGSAIPSLQGQAAADIVTAMQAFRSGERPATVMGRIAKGFSEEEARAIAEWLAKPEADSNAQP